MCTGFVQNFGGLAATRLLLGFFEGCLFPSMTLLLANWYKREELATRISYLFSKIILTNTHFSRTLTSSQLHQLFLEPLGVSSLLGFCTWMALLDILVGDGMFDTTKLPLTYANPLNPRLYILEGLITLVWAACCIFLVPKDFQSAYFLTEEEKAIMRIRAEHTEAYSGGQGHYTKKDIALAAKDIKSWMHGIIQIAVVTILYGKFFIYSLSNINHR